MREHRFNDNDNDNDDDNDDDDDNKNARYWERHGDEEIKGVSG